LLQPGDVCISANGTQHVLKTKTFIEEKAPVYNFEVEDAHTYYVGESLEQSVLVHNACPHCGSWWDAWHIFTMCPGKPMGSGDLYDAVNKYGINSGSNLAKQVTKNAEVVINASFKGKLPPGTVFPKEAMKELAKKNGWRKTNHLSMNEPVYYDPIKKVYITRDKKGHIGGSLKVADTVEKLGSDTASQIKNGL